jgi:DNA-binding HxlR family transcriptional regulator
MPLHADTDGPRFSAAVTRVARHPNAAVLCALGAGPKRQGELLEELGMLSETALATSLRELDGDSLIARRVDPGPPLRVLYELTPQGAALTHSLRALREWARRQA